MNLNQKIFLDALSRFVGHANHEATKLFGKLDQHLSPRIVAVAVPFQKSTGSTLVLPENSGVRVEWFGDVAKILEDIPASYLSNLAPDVRGVLWQDKVAIWKTIRSIVETEGGKAGYSSFAMYPAFIHGYSASLILQVPREVLDSYYSLTAYSNWGYPGTSLIYESIAAFLYKTVSPLEKLSSGVPGRILSEDGDEILRKAGYWLMDALEKACRTEDADVTHTQNLFRICNVVSSLFYERAETRGRMLISRRNHSNTGQMVTLKKPVTVRNYRGIRKLLEVSTTGLHLLCDSSGIYGIGKRSAPDEPQAQDLFVVDFTEHYTWKLSHAGHELMVVSHGQPRLPKKAIEENGFASRIQHEFASLSADGLMRLWEVVREAPQQKHGTMLVVSDHAQSEANRLGAQSTAIEPVFLKPDLMLAMTSIDGAILVDPSATCYAIGVILDGLTSKRGDSARGARYNSALRYLDHVRNLGHSCLIVVVSEDGTIDIL